MRLIPMLLVKIILECVAVAIIAVAVSLTLRGASLTESLFGFTGAILAGTIVGLALVSARARV
jgi:hypothetical protein